MRKLEGLKPEKVFRYFEDISAIPRGSGKEEAVSRYCLDFARERGLDLTLFMALLRKMDFSRLQFEKPMEDYSLGQKKKVLLAASLCQSAHLYIWDESLNYIDLFPRIHLEELILRLDGRGVPHSALWESGRRRRGQLQEEGFLERRLARRGGERETMPGGGEEISGAGGCFLRLKAGENLLLSGPGGMGKSRFLQELLRRGTRRYSPKEPAVALIPLADYQEAGESGNYIRKSLLRSLQPEEGADGEDTALVRLEEIFDLPLGRGGGCILLLDGLNESGERNQGLIREMEVLG